MNSTSHKNIFNNKKTCDQSMAKSSANREVYWEGLTHKTTYALPVIRFHAIHYKSLLKRTAHPIVCLMSNAFPFHQWLSTFLRSTLHSYIDRLLQFEWSFTYDMFSPYFLFNIFAVHLMPSVEYEVRGQRFMDVNGGATHMSDPWRQWIVWLW